MTEKRKFWIVWNETKVEGAIFATKRDAQSALDGRAYMIPEIGYPSISTLAESFYECYGEDGECFIEEVEL